MLRLPQPTNFYWKFAILWYHEIPFNVIEQFLIQGAIFQIAKKLRFFLRSCKSLYFLCMSIPNYILNHLFCMSAGAFVTASNLQKFE